MAFRIRQRDMLWGQAPCYLSLSLSSIKLCRAGKRSLLHTSSSVNSTISHSLSAYIQQLYGRKSFFFLAPLLFSQARLSIRHGKVFFDCSTYTTFFPFFPR